MKYLMRYLKILLLLLMVVICSMNLYSQPAKISKNLYTTWIKLALIGKNQAEIEYYFRDRGEEEIERIKKRIRFAILDSLNRSGIKNMIAKSTDADDINIIVRKVMTEIRYSGLEHDEDLRLSIKEKFGISLENL